MGGPFVKLMDSLCMQPASPGPSLSWSVGLCLCFSPCSSSVLEIRGFHFGQLQPTSAAPEDASPPWLQSPAWIDDLSSGLLAPCFCSFSDCSSRSAVCMTAALTFHVCHCCLLHTSRLLLTDELPAAPETLHSRCRLPHRLPYRLAKLPSNVHRLCVCQNK